MQLYHIYKPPRQPNEQQTQLINSQFRLQIAKCNNETTQLKPTPMVVVMKLALPC